MAEENVYIGIDVSKAWLDIAVEPSGQFWRAENNDRDITELSERLARLAPRYIIVEATGGYEARLVEHLCKAQLPVSRVNPGRVRRFAQRLNWLAKTDKIDAKLLTCFGEKASPRLTKLPNEDEKRLSALVKRRRPVSGIRTIQPWRDWFGLWLIASILWGSNGKAYSRIPSKRKPRMVIMAIIVWFLWSIP